MYKHLSILMLCAVTVVNAAPLVFTASLSGANENPANASTGTGSATVTWDSIAHTLGVNIQFADLLSPTTASHIHCCTTPPNNTIVATQLPRFIGFPTGVTSGLYNNVFDLTDPASFNPAFITANGGSVTSAEAALGAGLSAGLAYLNIHTDRFPGGEIRGFLAPVPEPTSMALFAGGFAALLLRRRILAL